MKSILLILIVWLAHTIKIITLPALNLVLKQYEVKLVGLKDIQYTYEYFVRQYDTKQEICEIIPSIPLVNNQDINAHFTKVNFNYLEQFQKFDIIKVFYFSNFIVTFTNHQTIQIFKYDSHINHNINLSVLIETINLMELDPQIVDVEQFKCVQINKKVLFGWRNLLIIYDLLKKSTTIIKKDLSQNLKGILVIEKNILILTSSSVLELRLEDNSLNNLISNESAKFIEFNFETNSKLLYLLDSKVGIIIYTIQMLSSSSNTTQIKFKPLNNDLSIQNCYQFTAGFNSLLIACSTQNQRKSKLYYYEVFYQNQKNQVQFRSLQMIYTHYIHQIILNPFFFLLKSTDIFQIYLTNPIDQGRYQQLKFEPRYSKKFRQSFLKGLRITNRGENTYWFDYVLFNEFHTQILSFPSQSQLKCSAKNQGNYKMTILQYGKCLMQKWQICQYIQDCEIKVWKSYQHSYFRTIGIFLIIFFVVAIILVSIYYFFNYKSYLEKLKYQSLLDEKKNPNQENQIRQDTNNQ